MIFMGYKTSMILHPALLGLKVRLATLRNLCCIFVDFITACFAYRPALAKTPSART